MVAREKIDELARRKRMVKAECDLHRAVISLECQNVAESLRWVETGARWSRRIGPLMPIAASMFGFFVMRKGVGLVSLAQKLFSGFKMARSVMKPPQ
ncbi:MAG: hypothetical protein HY301_09660 [Verrucomicrobia bacterium]|nr:hypothetical protein [Verrucomicrobiota bacterium]